ncbi:MAG: oligosaccharide repeat unit polymerase, partial [Patescibacteria group bacterium]
LILGLVSFALGYRAVRSRKNTFPRLGLDKPWKEKNIFWTFTALLCVTLAGKVIMFLNGHYFISTRVFHFEPLFGSINSPGFGQFTGYFAIPGFVLVALAFTRYFQLVKEENASRRIWGRISWSLLTLEVVSGLLTGNRLPVITVIMIYAVVRHYAHKKSWKHFVAVLAFNVMVVMPVGSFIERPGDMRSALKTSKPSQVILDSTIGRFSQNVVVSAIIEKTEQYSYGKSLLNIFVSLGPPRFIWKDKPIISPRGNEFGRRYGIINSFDFNTNVGPTMVGDLYMNFGVWGIMGGLFLIGFLFRFLFDFCISSLSRAPGGIMLYALLWPDLIKGMENDVVSVFAGAVKLGVFAYLIHLCLVADWKFLIKKIGGFWRPLVYGVFMWLLVGDAVRKLIPTEPWQLMLVLDIVLLFAYVLFITDCIVKKMSLWRPLFLFPSILFFAVFLVSVFGPFSGGLGAGIVGFRNYFWFIPLVWLGYHAFATKEEVLKFCRALLWAAIPLAFFSGLEIMFPNALSFILGPFGGGNAFHAGAPESIRLTSSLFGSVQRFGMVSMLLFFIGLAVKSPATLFAFAGVLLSGSRSAFALSVIGGIALFVLRKNYKILAGIFAVLALFWALPSFRSVVSFQVKESIPMIATSRIHIFAGEMKEVWRRVSWFGNGAGSFSQGIEYVGSRQKASYEKSLGETGIRNLLFELGIIGLATFYCMWGSIGLAMVKGIKIIKDLEMRALGVAIFIFTLAVLLRSTFMHGQTLNDYAVLVPLWFFIGAFFKLKALAEKRGN